MKKYTKPSIKFAAFKNSTKTSTLTRETTSPVAFGGTKMNSMSFKVNPLDPKVK